ncbi:nucleotide disphospho-sugar-binding domain-containing protein [Dactylosporangium sp. CA-139066]|uniref:nucleotide disphospho-sugar-binding domain-containing protein n=1 Tax=Dactylosporangium sp. CA-139066 TaxID=3239930 RepID=UPI003D949C90
MRVLIVVAPVTAHLFPSVPLAQALQSAGHEVRVASNTSMGDRISGAGLTAVGIGDDTPAPPNVSKEDLDRFTEALGFEPGSWFDRIWQATGFYTMGSCTRVHPDADGRALLADNLVAFARQWRPDLVVWDQASPIGAIATREAGAASARLMWGPDYFGWVHWRLTERIARGELQTNPLAEILAPVFERFDYDYSEDLLLGDFTVDPNPMQLPRPAGHHAVPMQWVPYTSSAPVQEWLLQPPSRPRVCLSLGVTARTFFAGRDERVAAVFDAVADMDVEVVATVNADQLGDDSKVPDNVRILDYVPLTQVIPSCSAVIHHGGYGTAFTAGAHRVPQLTVMEEWGSALCVTPYLEARGAGVTIHADGLTAEKVHHELSRLLTEPEFQQGAARVQADLAGAPSPTEIVPILERLTAQYRTRD